MQHHANLLIGPKEWAFSELPSEYSRENQDIRFLDYENMAVAETRKLIDEANLMAIDSDEHVFVISASSILHEAQNTLLKLFEEPNPHTIFYLILPREDILLPTLRSRLNLFAVSSEKSNKDIFNEFLSASYAERLTIIEKRLKEEDFEWVGEIVRGLEEHASESKDKSLIESVLLLVRYIHTKGSSKKMLLEQVALSLS